MSRATCGSGEGAGTAGSGTVVSISCCAYSRTRTLRPEHPSRVEERSTASATTAAAEPTGVVATRWIAASDGRGAAFSDVRSEVARVLHATAKPLRRGFVSPRQSGFRAVDAMERCGNRRPRVERLVSAWNQGIRGDADAEARADDPLIGAAAEPSKRALRICGGGGWDTPVRSGSAG